MVQHVLQPVDTMFLKLDQLHTFDVVANHLTRALAGTKPSRLRMRMQGEGGTGKLIVIRCIAEIFQRRGIPERLLKGEYTGIAAPLVDGNTYCILCHLSSCRK